MIEPANNILRLEQFFVILECPVKRCHPAFRYSPQLINTSRYQMFIVTYLQVNKDASEVKSYYRTLRCITVVYIIFPGKWSKECYTIRTPPWNKTRPWINASTASKSYNPTILSHTRTKKCNYRSVQLMQKLQSRKQIKYTVIVQGIPLYSRYHKITSIRLGTHQ